MNEFTERELKLVRRLKDRPAQTILQNKEACKQHSLCFPLPLFRVYKVDDDTFQAEWNDYHCAGTKQTFRFADIIHSEQPVS